MQPTKPKEDVVEVDPHAKASKERDHQEASKNEVVTNPEVIDNMVHGSLRGSHLVGDQERNQGRKTSFRTKECRNHLGERSQLGGSFAALAELQDKNEPIRSQWQNVEETFELELGLVPNIPLMKCKGKRPTIQVNGKENQYPNPPIDRAITQNKGRPGP